MAGWSDLSQLSQSVPQKISWDTWDSGTVGTVGQVLRLWLMDDITPLTLIGSETHDVIKRVCQNTVMTEKTSSSNYGYLSKCPQRDGSFEDTFFSSCPQRDGSFEDKLLG